MTDEEIDKWCAGNNYAGTVPGARRFARAIESAATAPLLAEIERLKERVKELEEQPATELQIAEALRKSGLTLIKKQGGYSVIELGQITAQPSQEEPRQMWDGSPMPNYTITREQ